MAWSLSYFRYWKLALTTIVNLATAMLIHSCNGVFAVTKGHRSSEAQLILWIPFGFGMASIAAAVDNFLPQSCGRVASDKKQPTRMVLPWCLAALLATTLILFALK
jgi:hypothetical protein